MGNDPDRDIRLASLGRLAATMAHEFNNVLMAIQPFVELISRGATPAMTEKALKHIALAIQRGRRITAEVLQMANPAEPSVKSVDVGAWMRSTEFDLRALLPANVALRIEIDDGGEPLYAGMDISQMNQVLQNLVANGKDAMADGGLIVVSTARCYSWSTFVFATLPTPDRFVQLTVADTGGGMDAATLDKIFEPLFTTKRSGTGLGLVVVQQIVQRHGGTVSVESSVGGGTRFHLFLPAALPPQFEDAPQGSGQLAICPHDLRLLIMEDDRNVSTAMANNLRQHGFHVDVIYTGGRALEAVRRFAADALILDVGLPDVSGREVFWTIRREFPQLPVLFSTAHAEEASLAEELAEPAVAYLRKPYSTETLLNALARITTAV